MKKLIAMLACLTLVLTMFAGLTVSAATDYGTPTFKLVPQTEADGSLAVIDGCYVVDVVYEGFQNFSPYNGSSRKPSATGIMGLEIYWSNDNDTAYTYDGADTGVGVGGSVEVATISATKAADIVTATEGTICSAYYIINDENAVANLKIDSVVINLRSYVDGAAVEEGKVDLATADAVFEGCTLGKAAPAPVDPVVTYEGETNIVWGAKGAYAEGKATFSVKPVMGYTIAVTANGEAVAIDAAKGGEVTIDVTEDTTVVATATAITDGAYTYGETYKDGNTVYVFGKAPGAANFGFYVEKDGAALANKALEIYDGYFAATSGSANAFGMSFAFTGKGHTGAYTAAAYGDADVATTTAAFNID